MSMCNCNQGRLPCTCKPIEGATVMSEVKRYSACIDGVPISHEVVMASDFDRVTAERDALQQLLNAADQGKDDLSFQLKDREASRYDWLQAAQAAEKECERLSEERDSFQRVGIQAMEQLAERDALLRDLNIIRPGQPGCGDFSREQRTWADLAKHLSASAEPAKSQLVECDACPRSGGCVGSCMKAPASAEPSAAKCDRCEGNGKYPILGACPKCGCEPVERDERAEFEAVCKQLGYLTTRHHGLPNQYKEITMQCMWQTWMARAALDKSTKGASHE